MTTKKTTKKTLEIQDLRSGDYVVRRPRHCMWRGVLTIDRHRDQITVDDPSGGAWCHRVGDVGLERAVYDERRWGIRLSRETLADEGMTVGRVLGTVHGCQIARVRRD